MATPSKVTGIVKSVKRVSSNGVDKLLIEFSNGDQMWPSESYLDSVFKAKDLEGARIGVLEQCVVTYNKVAHKAGDVVLDKDGNKVLATEGQSANSDGYRTYTKDNVSISQLQIEELSPSAERFQDKYDEHIQKAKATNKLSAGQRLADYFAKTSVTPNGITDTPTATNAPLPVVQDNEEEIG